MRSCFFLLLLTRPLERREGGRGRTCSLFIFSFFLSFLACCYVPRSHSLLVLLVVDEKETNGTHDNGTRKDKVLGIGMATRAPDVIVIVLVLAIVIAIPLFLGKGDPTEEARGVIHL